MASTATATPVVTKMKKERKSTDLTQKEITMLKANTNMSEKEIKVWHTEFLQKSPSGKVDKETFGNLYKQLYPKNASGLTDETFNEIDKNKDGTIDFNEFLFFVTVHNRTDNLDERLDVMFDLWDVSNNGSIDQNELAHLISAMYDRAGKKDRQGDQNPTKRAKDIIAKFDSSSDKKLSKDEFIQGCKTDEAIRALLTAGH